MMTPQFKHQHTLSEYYIQSTHSLTIHPLPSNKSYKKSNSLYYKHQIFACFHNNNKKNHRIFNVKFDVMNALLDSLHYLDTNKHVIKLLFLDVLI